MFFSYGFILLIAGILIIVLAIIKLLRLYFKMRDVSIDDLTKKLEHDSNRETKSVEFLAKRKEIIDNLNYKAYPNPVDKTVKINQDKTETLVL